MDLKVEHGESLITHTPVDTVYRWTRLTIGPAEWTIMYGRPPLRFSFTLFCQGWRIAFDVDHWEKKDG